MLAFSFVFLIIAGFGAYSYLFQGGQTAVSDGVWAGIYALLGIILAWLGSGFLLSRVRVSGRKVSTYNSVWRMARRSSIASNDIEQCGSEEAPCLVPIMRLDSGREITLDPLVWPVAGWIGDKSLSGADMQRRIINDIRWMVGVGGTNAEVMTSS